MGFGFGFVVCVDLYLVDVMMSVSGTRDDDLRRHGLWCLFYV